MARTRPFAALATGVLLAALVTCQDVERPTAPDQVSDVPAPNPSHTASGAAVLVGAGDVASCPKDRDEATAALLDNIPGTVFTLGDNAYQNASDADYANCYEPSWGRHKGRTHPAPGEREYKQPGATPYFNYFGAAAGDPTQGYYSYDLGGWHIVVLNSAISTSATSPQVQWLRADLAANTQMCVLAYWHHPLFYSTGSTGVQTSIRPLWDVLYEYRAEVVLNAHKRWYERFGRQNPAGQADPAGIREFIVGTGGAGTNPFGNIRPNSEVRQEEIHGVLKLELSPTGYTWEFIPRAGFTFTDSGAESCHEAADLPVANPGGPYRERATVQFDGTGSSDPQGDLPLAYNWAFGDGQTGTGATPTHTYAADGEYTVTLTVVDALGNASPPAATTATIFGYAPPVAEAGGPYSSESRTIQFDGGASSDPQGDVPLSYAWDFGDGTTGSGATPTHTYAADGQYAVTLTVTDALGTPSAPDATTVTIANVPPTVDAGPDQTVAPGELVTVSVTFTDPGIDDAPWSWTIAWGDGSPDDAGTATDPSLPIVRTHAYAAAGAYVVMATVTDKDGGAGTDDLTVIVRQPGAEVALLAAGDISSCSNNRDELTARILDAHEGTVVTLGDNAYPDGTTADYNNCYHPTWGRHRDRTYAAIGNHEYGAGNATGTWDYFGDRAGPRGLGYYSFDLGEWHIIVLNDNKDFVPFTAGSPQEVWLRNDLAANTKLCTLAIWHQPRFLSSNEAGFTERFSRKILWDDLYVAGADLVLNGHQHHYERFAPQTPDGVRDDVQGIRQFIIGTGGESIELPTVEIHPNSELRAAPFGVMKFTLQPGGYTWEFFPMEGVAFTDSGSGTCH